MKRPKDVVFSPEAESQIVGIDEYLADHASPASAEAYANAVVERCEQLGDMPLIGIARGDIRPGLRTAFFRKRVVIAYASRPSPSPFSGSSMAGRTTRACFETSSPEGRDGATYATRCHPLAKADLAETRHSQTWPQRT